MTTLATNRRSLPSQDGKDRRPASQETTQLISLADEHRWPFQVLGKAPMPDVPVRLGDWLLVPAQVDSSPIPQRAWERIQAIFGAGIRPQGFVLVHEAPMMLTAPDGLPSSERDVAIRESQWPGHSGLTELGAVLGAGVAAASGLAALAVGALALIAAVLPITLMAGALMLDPILVAVTEDGYWVEIDRWDTPPRPKGV